MRGLPLAVTLLMAANGCALLKPFEKAEEVPPHEREWQLREHLLHHPEDVKALEDLAEWMVMRMGRGDAAPEEAEISVRALLERAPQHAMGLLWLGDVLIALDKPEEAKSLYLRALVQDPENRELFDKVTGWMVDTEQYAEVKPLLLRHLDESPDTLPVWVRLAQVQSALGEDNEATYRQIVARDPREPEAVAGLVALLRAKKRFEEALPLLEPLRQGNSPQWEWTYRRVILLDDAGRYAEAERDASQLIAQDPHNVLAVHQWAIELGKLGRWAEAEAAFRKALAISEHPYDPHAIPAVIQCNLAYVLATLGQDGEVELCYRAAMQLAPRMGRVQFYFGRWLVERGRQKEADSLLKQAKALDPTVNDDEGDRFIKLVLE